MLQDPKIIETEKDKETEQDNGRLLPWELGNLPDPPKPGWRLWIGLIGPGVVLAGTSIGSGEWLFGPALTAQYGANLLWLASISIILQVFCNLMMMRYAVYSGEPIIVGGLRTWPGPMAWIFIYLILDFAAIWPYNASNAAVPLAAAILGHLPRAEDVHLVKFLGYTIFLLSFLPLLFGGTVYRMLEAIMTFKLAVVLIFLSVIALFMVSGSVAWEVASGFFRFGSIPLRADTIIAQTHFSLSELDGSTRFLLRGTIEEGKPTIADFRVTENSKSTLYRHGNGIPTTVKPRFDSMSMRAQELAKPNRFYVESTEGGTVLAMAGRVELSQQWTPERFDIIEKGATNSFSRIQDLPDPHARLFQQWLKNRSIEPVGIASYVMEKGVLPPSDWAIVAAFCAIAGAGGLSNTLFSNYARDKGWGMGAHVGAIPSAVGGRTIALSHTGKVFPVNPENLSRWRRWMRHIFRDQVAIWMVCSFLGMALPCMMSLEFIRNSTVEGHRVAAMAAEGMAERYPDFRWFLWTMTLLCGFLVLAPGQISVGDQIARRWTDIIWTGTKWTKRLPATRVKAVYYGILAIYCCWGLVALSLFNPLQIAKIGAILGNVALAIASLQSIHVNRSLMPRELQPHWLLTLGTLICAIFFMGLTVLVVLML